MAHRYHVVYGSTVGSMRAYAVHDTVEKRIKRESDHKPTCIEAAQRLNGFTPADGNEKTYGDQIAENFE